MLAALLATSAALAAPAHAQVIYTENFNGGTPSNGSYANGSQIGGTTITPRTGATYIINQSPGDNMASITAGQYQSVIGQSSFEATSMFNLFAGFTYTVQFSQAVGNLGSGPAAGPWGLAVSLGGYATNFGGSGSMDWTAREFSFTTNADVTNGFLSFVYFNPVNNPPGGYGYNAAFIDDITITASRANDPPPTTVPEPASLALLAAGFAGLTLVSRRRRVV